MSAAAVAKIASARPRNSQDHTTPMPRHAWLISSLKNPVGVEVFRRVYGAGFFLIGLFATEAERKQSLELRMTPRDATELIVRDREAEQKYGQQTRKTFEQTPTDAEDGMALAYSASLRSSDLSRQVGAVGSADRCLGERGDAVLHDLSVS